MNAGAIIQVNRGTREKPDIRYVAFGSVLGITLTKRPSQAYTYSSRAAARLGITELLGDGKSTRHGRPSLRKEWRPVALQLVVKGT